MEGFARVWLLTASILAAIVALSFLLLAGDVVTYQEGCPAPDADGVGCTVAGWLEVLVILGGPVALAMVVLGVGAFLLGRLSRRGE